MSIQNKLDQLEEKFYDEMDEDRDTLIDSLIGIHREAESKGGKDWVEFKDEVTSRFGGAYIPYIFWVELAEFSTDEENRTRLHDLIQKFANSAFEEPERKKMKPLIITYLAMEKEFEIDKLKTQVIEKSHPEVQEYFRKLSDFVEKNQSSVEMYIEKFQMLKDMDPDFSLMNMPVTRLREKLG